MKIQYHYHNREQISPNLICPVCEEPFVDPVEHKEDVECEQFYCKECGPGKCSSCGLSPSTWKDVPLSRAAKFSLFNPLDNLHVICDSCGKLFKRVDFSSHLLSCPVGMSFFVSVD